MEENPSIRRKMGEELFKAAGLSVLSLSNRVTLVSVLKIKLTTTTFIPYYKNPFGNNASAVSPSS